MTSGVYILDHPFLHNNTKIGSSTSEEESKMDKRFGTGGKITKISGLSDTSNYVAQKDNTIKYYNDRIRFIQLGNNGIWEYKLALCLKAEQSGQSKAKQYMRVSRSEAGCMITSNVLRRGIYQKKESLN